MLLYDFECPKCGKIREELVSNPDEKILCDNCGKNMHRIFVKSAVILTTIIPSYPGCKTQKAGYVHTHGDRPATKVLSGPAGCVNPPSK